MAEPEKARTVRRRSAPAWTSGSNLSPRIDSPQTSPTPFPFPDLAIPLYNRPANRKIPGMPTTRRDFLKSGTMIASTLAGQGLLASPGYVRGAEPAGHRVKVALVGTAHSHALGKLAALLRLPDLYEVVGIVEPDEQRRQTLARQVEFAAIPLLTEEQLLNVPGIQAVLVETQVKDVVPTAIRLAAAGLHIHVEKPGGASLPAFGRLVDIVRQKSRILQTGYMLRNNPGFEFCAQAVRDGLLGDIYEVHGVMGKVADANERKINAPFPAA